MKKTSNISQTKKNQLASELEAQKNKIVSEKRNKLWEQKAAEKKQEIAKALAQEENQRKSQLDNAYNSEPWFICAIYRIRSLFNRASPQELYHEALLRELRYKLQKANRGLVITNDGKISGKFIAKLYGAYIQASRLGNILNAMFNQKKSMEMYTRYAFKYLYKDVEMKRNLEDIVDLDTLKEKVQTGGETLTQYQEEYQTAIRQYVRTLNSEFTDYLLLGLKELHYLFLFVSFDYKKFFTSLGGNVDALKSGRFQDCRISPGLKTSLETFYQFLPALLRVSNNVVARYILTCGTLALENGSSLTLQDIREALSKNESIHMNIFSEFCKIWETTICKYPFEDLICLCSGDCFYKPKSTELAPLKLGKIHVQRAIERQLNSELDNFINQFRKEFNENTQNNLLIDYEDTLLDYYNKDSITDTHHFYSGLGFHYVEEINIIYNFLKKYYVKNIKNIFTFLIRQILPKGSSLSRILMNQNMALESLEERIRNFNRELGPDKPWGKSLMNFTYRMEKHDTGNLVKQIKELIEEVDSDAKGLLKKTEDVFDSAIQPLQTIITTENQKLAAALEVMIPDTECTLLEGIENAIHAFKSMESLIHSYQN